MEQNARYKPGKDVTVFAEEQLPAGRFVTTQATKTAQGDYKGKLSPANEAHPFGVTQRDSGPTTDPVTSWTRRVDCVRRGAIAMVKAAAGITGGKDVYISGNGEIKEWESGKNAVGRCLATVAEGEYAEVDVY